MPLYNQIDKKILRQQIESVPQKRLTLSFYKYHHIENPQFFRDDLYRDWSQMNVLGRIYIAKEGINAQLCFPAKKKEVFIQHLYSIPFLNGVKLNFAVEEKIYSFIKLKIKVRDKIVADGLNDNSFDVTNKGKYLDAKSFNELIDRKDTLLIDMRNHYESEIGHFKGAFLPDVDTFREALQVVKNVLAKDENKDKNIVMYCTGGIRCEKASAYYKHIRYKKVFQLQGGITEYAREVKEKKLSNKFIGRNFVFDERMGESISKKVISFCHQCEASCDIHVNCPNDGCHLLFLQCSSCTKKFDGCCSTKCQDIIKLPEETQKAMRKGKNNGIQVYRKGRIPMRA